MSITTIFTGSLFSLPFLILFLPFLVVPGVYNSYEFPKYIFIVVLIQIFILLRVLYCLKKSLKPIHLDTLSLVVIGFLLILFIANIFGLDLQISLLGSIYRHQGFLLFLSFGVLFLLLHALPKTEKDTVLYKFLKYSVITVLALSIITLVQGIRFFLFHDYSIPTIQGRMVATLGNPNILAGYVVMLLPLAIFGTTLYKIPQAKKYLLQLTICIGALCVLILTGSKSALLALILISIIVILTKESNTKTTQKYWIFEMRNLKFEILLLVLLVPLILLILFHTNRYSQWDNRGIIWSYGISAIQKSPLLGYGQENYELIVDKTRHIPIDNAHNIFLELAVAGGIPTLFLFCIICFITFRQSIYPVKLSLLAFLVCASFNPLSVAQLATFWFLISLAQSK